MELRPGHRIDRYELVAPLARGGMGAVWLARVQRMPGFEKFFAVKTVLPQYAADPAFRKMFIDEARIACAINHPNVAAIIDVGEEAGMLFTVMEWVDGDSLDALKRTVEAEGGRIPHGIVLRLMSDACGGLHAAHEARDRSGKLLEIVHRDISPHNILIDPQGAAMLIDFGIALARDRVAETTSSGLKGKVRYMSPEQAEGGTDIDRRADVRAVGAVMYRLIEGHAPYEGASELSVLRSLFTESSPDPMRANLPAPLAAVIMKCLSRDRSARYESAGELQRALEIAMRDANVMTTSADVAAYAKTRLAKRVSTRRAKIGAILSQLDNRAIPPREPPPREPSLGDPPPRREPCSSTAITLSDAAAPPPAEAEIIPTIDLIDMNLGADGTLGAGSFHTADRLPRTRPVAVRRAIPATLVLLVAGVVGGRLASRAEHPSAATAHPAPTPSFTAQAVVVPAAVDSAPEPAAVLAPAVPSGIPFPVLPPAATATEEPAPSSTAVAAAPARVPAASKHPVVKPVAHRNVVDCDPPFTVDADGFRHYKRECAR